MKISDNAYRMLHSEAIPAHYEMLKDSQMLLSGKGRSRKATDGDGHPAVFVSVKEFYRFIAFAHNTRFLFPEIVSTDESDAAIDAAEAIIRVVKLLRRRDFVQDYEMEHAINSVKGLIKFVMAIQSSTKNGRSLL